MNAGCEGLSKPLLKVVPDDLDHFAEQGGRLGGFS